MGSFCIGVSIGVLGVTCKHLRSKREWKVLFERVEHHSGQWERPTTPAPDETKPARPLAPGFGTRSEPTPHRQLLRVGATKTERGLQPARKNEGTKLTSGATSRSGKEPNFQYNNYQQKPFYNNNQQGGYQARQNYPQGFPSKGNQSTQGQASSSTSTTQESSTDTMLKQILESQTRSEKHIGYELKNLHTKVDGSYNDLNNKWNKAQDRTIFKLKTKYKELKKTVKRQAEASPQFMKKVADLLDRGGVGGYSSENFVTRDTSVPQPQPFNPVTNPSLAFGPPLTVRQLLRLARNPKAPESNSGNKSPSLPQPMTKPTMRSYVTGTMTKTNKTYMEARKAAAAKRETALRRKPLEPSEPSQLGVERTSRQQVLAEKKAKEREKRGDKSKTPTADELYHHLFNRVSWVPTRFADTKMMEELGIEGDIKTMLQHMKMESFYSMAYPTYKEVNGKTHYMSFKDIGAMMGLEDNEDPTLPRFNKLPNGVWRVISGNLHATGHDKNSAIRHPAVRYLHRILVHTLYPRKEPGTVNEEELRLLYRAVRDNVTPEHLEEFEEIDEMTFPTTNIFEDFGMVGLFVERLMYYKDWVWTTRPSFIDAPYLRIATYISGRYHEKVIYTYFLKGKMAELLLPNRELTCIEKAGIIHFNIAESEFFGSHGPIDRVTAPRQKKGGVRGGVRAETSAATQGESATPIYGPPHYHFTQRSTSLPHGPLREAHEHIGNLQRWNKAQDMTIFKLQTKYKELKKELKKTVKRQAEASAQFMKKVADLLVRGGVGGCSSEDFVTRDTSLLRLARKPEAPESNSGNKSPSLASTDDKTDNEEVASEPQAYFTTFPDDTGDEATAFSRTLRQVLHHLTIVYTSLVFI
ncbi:hypothetical protein DY000_02029670 [Brassica cretica]|uniref:Arabidopsis retrotransposon Orf1 C-terminal domain-containing protein n=1 Tax=Brassica cretica TaxID=69181 RepID=A0ABQ7DKL9_BRACR|nr:hypothetical protein DY000_02029670 [Brassica cretica]